ncbi:MAG TPA: class I SAM-dependent methyltransferase [Thermomicrobiales bacterium]|jgi:SAM-dependent methyltransferase
MGSAGQINSPRGTSRDDARIDWTQQLLHLIATRHPVRPADHDETYFRDGFGQTEKFVRRFAGQLDYRDKTVLDLGCGFGSTAIALALGGARRVVGVDIDARRVTFAQRTLAADYAALTRRVTFRTITDFNELDDGQFNLIVSKDSFEHYAEPERFVPALLPHLAPEGRIAIGFGPLWKSPYGGHISYMTRLPWAHLLFPERTIMRERRRFFPNDPVEHYSAIIGGLNRMTLARFTGIMGSSGLTATYFRTNVSEHSLARLLDLGTRLPGIREYATFNCYSAWQRRAAES